MAPRKMFATWLKVDKKLQLWIDAFVSIDQSEDNTKLLKLLCSRSPIPERARHHLADLLSRHQLKARPGNQKTPSYTLSETAARLQWAEESMKRQKIEGLNGKDKEDALGNTARVYGVTKEVLRLHLDGKHSSSRRNRKRLAGR